MKNKKQKDNKNIDSKNKIQSEKFYKEIRRDFEKYIKNYNGAKQEENDWISEEDIGLEYFDEEDCRF